jgi:hypothetical protein
MKNLFLSLITISILSTLSCSSCKKEIVIDNSGLPPTTQTGANTLGFTLNGQPWIPQGNNGTANLSIDYDAGFNNGVFGISAYKIINTNNREYFGIGLKDSLNFMVAPFNINLSNTSLYRIRFDNGICSYFSTDTDTKTSGSLTVNKLDRINRIISGTFNATLSKAGCDTIKITDGRFDMKF